VHPHLLQKVFDYLRQQDVINTFSTFVPLSLLLLKVGIKQQPLWLPQRPPLDVV